jgi:hypothetical protein
MKSIGFLQDAGPSDRSPAQAMDSIGFIQNPKGAQEAKPLPTIGFTQSPDHVKIEPKQQEGADVGYRYELTIDPKYGHFELSKVAP